MKQKLTERYIIDLMKEEWEKKINSILEKAEKPATDLKIHMDVDGDGTKETVVSPKLKVRKKGPKDMEKDSKKELPTKSDPVAGLVYDVESIDDRDHTITLSRLDVNDGEKKTITITQKEFEKNYKRK